MVENIYFESEKKRGYRILYPYTIYIYISISLEWEGTEQEFPLLFSCGRIMNSFSKLLDTFKSDYFKMTRECVKNWSFH